MKDCSDVRRIALQHIPVSPLATVNIPHPDADSHSVTFKSLDAKVQTLAEKTKPPVTAFVGFPPPPSGPYGVDASGDPVNYENTGANDD